MWTYLDLEIQPVETIGRDRESQIHLDLRASNLIKMHLWEDMKLSFLEEK